MARRAGPPSWIDDEPDRRLIWRELLRLKARARARPIRTLLLALLMALGVVGMQARKVKKYFARIIIRVAEEDVELEGRSRSGVATPEAPRPKSKLREYVTDVAFTNGRLREVIDEHELYPTWSFDPNFQIFSLREDLEVEVFRNYFLLERDAGDAPRTARIAIGYYDADPDIALEVARHLGRLVIEQESLERQLQAQNALAVATRVVDQLGREADHDREEMTRRVVALTRATRKSERTILQIEIAQLQRGLRHSELMLSRAQEQKSAFAMRVELEKRRLGMTFTVVDWGKATKVQRRKAVSLGIIGVVAFFLALPFAAVAIGAFDSRVYNTDDVRRLGIEVVGHVPHFPGDHVATLAARRKES